jgi:uncharacterized membrane protein
MKRALYIFIGVIAVVLAIGWYKVEKLPKANTEGFSVEAADITSTPFDELTKGKVTEVKAKDEVQNSHLSQINETLQVTLLNGSEKDKSVEVDYQDTLTNPKLQEIKTNDIVVIGKLKSVEGESSPNGLTYVLVDRYRLPVLAYAGILFLILAVIFGRLRGLTSIIGLGVSVMILLTFVTPNILAGKNPVLVTLVGAGIIALVSMFLAHGFKKRAVLAVVSTILALALAEGLGYGLIFAAKLLGNGSEASFFLQAGYFGAINLQGLLLGGIIIGTLGILNDITIAQSATVEELHLTNPKLSFKELYIKGSSVGREHIASLINTLVLVYVGASLPLFLLFTINGQQLWTVLNSSTIAEEIVRTLVGSISLIIAVPIATALTAYYFHSEANKPQALPAVNPDLDNYWDRAKSVFKKKDVK